MTKGSRRSPPPSRERPPTPQTIREAEAAAAAARAAVLAERDPTPRRARTTSSGQMRAITVPAPRRRLTPPRPPVAAAEVAMPAASEGTATSWAKRAGVWIAILVAASGAYAWLARLEWAPQVASVQAQEKCTEQLAEVKRALSSEIKVADGLNAAERSDLRDSIAKTREELVRTSTGLGEVQRSLVEMRAQQRQDQQETRRALRELLRRRGR